MSMLTVWTLWEVMSVTVLQDTLEMEHTALVRILSFSFSSHQLFQRISPLWRKICTSITSFNTNCVVLTSGNNSQTRLCSIVPIIISLFYSYKSNLSQ